VPTRRRFFGADRRELLRELSFSSSSPLRTETENWFLRELRGRLNHHDRMIRLGTCKRSAGKLAPDFARFDAHVARFVERSAQVGGWRVEKAAIATRHSAATRNAAERVGSIPQDLEDLTADL